MLKIKRLRVLMTIIFICAMTATPIFAVSFNSWKLALDTTAQSIEKYKYEYNGSLKGGSVNDIGKGTKKCNCADFVYWSMQRGGIVGKQDEPRINIASANGKVTISSNLRGKVRVISMNKGSSMTYVNKYISGKSYGPAGEFPKLTQLIAWGAIKKGDIIAQWDNPKNKFKGKLQVRKFGTGTQGHLEVFMGTKAITPKHIIYSVGAEYQESKKDGKLRASLIKSSENDTRNQHNNPHVAAIIRIN